MAQQRLLAAALTPCRVTLVRCCSHAHCGNALASQRDSARHGTACGRSGRCTLGVLSATAGLPACAWHTGRVGVHRQAQDARARGGAVCGRPLRRRREGFGPAAQHHQDRTFTSARLHPRSHAHAPSVVRSEALDALRFALAHERSCDLARIGSARHGTARHGTAETQRSSRNGNRSKCGIAVRNRQTASNA